MTGGQFTPSKPSGSSDVSNPRQAAYEGRMQAMNKSNENAADALRSMLVSVAAADVTWMWSLCWNISVCGQAMYNRGRLVVKLKAELSKSLHA